LWYVHCKWCDEEARLQAPNKDEACRMLEEWRLSMPCRPSEERFWSCPTCAEEHQDPKPTTTDTAESASQEVDDVKLRIQQLKAEVVELKAEVERLKAEVVELKDEGTKQTTKAIIGPTIVVTFTE
ncbi:septum formation initiator family protein, partial [bacterium]|nr:septum formation initiator family protein [bacterium]